MGGGENTYDGRTERREGGEISALIIYRVGEVEKKVEKLDEKTAALLTDALVAAFSNGFAMPPVNYLKIAAASILVAFIWCISQSTTIHKIA